MKNKCKRCGACCFHMSCPAYLDEFMTTPLEIRVIVLWFRKNDRGRLGWNMPCYFFNLRTRECLIHKYKPQVCRDFEPCSADCERLRAKYLPGMKHLNETLDS